LLFFTNVEKFSPRTIIKTKANNRKRKTKYSPHFRSIFSTNKQIRTKLPKTNRKNKIKNKKAKTSKPKTSVKKIEIQMQTTYIYEEIPNVKQTLENKSRTIFFRKKEKEKRK
jgi:hypothetical protein